MLTTVRTTGDVCEVATAGATRPSAGPLAPHGGSPRHGEAVRILEQEATLGSLKHRFEGGDRALGNVETLLLCIDLSLGRLEEGRGAGLVARLVEAVDWDGVVVERLGVQGRSSL